MAKDTRLQFRVSQEKKARFEKCATKVKLDQTALGTAAVEALCDYIEANGEITLPLAILPESVLNRLKMPTARPPFPSTATRPVAPEPSMLNEDPPGKARDTKPTSPRMTRTRAKIRGMIAKEKQQPPEKK